MVFPVESYFLFSVTESFRFDQGDGARRLRAYVASKGRELKRARVESRQWRTRCGAMQRR